MNPASRPPLSQTLRIAAVALLLVPAAAAQAGPGADAFAAGDYRRALAILEPQARRGQAEAQYLLGRMREQGLGVEADRARARHWYMQAAAQGYMPARAALATLDAGTTAPAGAAAAPPAAPLGDAQRLQAMLAGRIAADAARAADLAQALALRAEAGDTVVAVLLGEYLESPLGGADFAAAARWYERAAAAGHPVAQNNLGAMYYDGRGVLQSFAEAQRLYARAADQGHRVAQFNLALMLGQGKAGPADAQAMNAWLEKSAAQGYARAQAQLGRFQLEGVLGPPDARAAARQFRLAAEQGLPLAQYWLGRMVSRGEGVARDLEDGAAWMLKAADNGHPIAMLEAARILEMGLGLVSDTQRALAYYRRAGEAGVTAAAERLARAYAQGELGLAADGTEAARWAALAAR